MPPLQVTGNSLDKQEANILKKYYGDKFEVEQTSDLSLFLYTRSMTVLAKNSNGAVIGSHLYVNAEELNLEEILQKDTLINGNNTSGKLFVHNDDFCLVPSMLFDPTVKSTYLKFSTEVDEEKQEVFYEGVDSNNVQVIGGIDRKILASFDHVLPDMEISHGASFILSYLMKGKNDMLGQELFVVAEEGHIYLAGFSGSELKVFNRFQVSGNGDFLKYTFAVLHQLSFDRMHCRITLLGKLTGVGLEAELLHGYFKNILITEPRFNQTYAPGAEKFRESGLLESFWTV